MLMMRLASSLLTGLTHPHVASDGLADLTPLAVGAGIAPWIRVIKLRAHSLITVLFAFPPWVLIRGVTVFADLQTRVQDTSRPGFGPVADLGTVRVQMRP
jgi:predicted lysophospholipase L1 biosynthesis ABC-type transport system permease subunit